MNERCCANCDYYEGALCMLWIEGDTECIEDIEYDETEVCENWEGEPE